MKRKGATVGPTDGAGSESEWPTEVIETLYNLDLDPHDAPVTDITRALNDELGTAYSEATVRRELDLLAADELEDMKREADMTVGDLRKALEGVGDDVPVFVNGRQPAAFFDLRPVDCGEDRAQRYCYFHILK